MFSTPLTLLLDRGGHGVGDDPGVGAGIVRGDGDGRRRDFGILRDRQLDAGRPAPMMTITSERTVAKIGRSTKNRANIVGRPFSCSRCWSIGRFDRRPRHGRLLGIDLDSLRARAECR